MKKQILLPIAVKRELRDTLGVHVAILERALKYERNSKRDKMLRAEALRCGGLIYTGTQAPTSYVPNVETRHDHVRGVMYQSFGERVELQVDRETNATTIFIDNESVATFNDMTLGNWGNVLYSLQMIYNQLNA